MSSSLIPGFADSALQADRSEPEGPVCAEVIGLVGRLGTPQLACLRSWRRAGVPVVFLHADAAPLPRWLQLLLGVPCVHLGPLQAEDPVWVDALAQALVQHGVGALTCVSEPISLALWTLQSRLPAGVRIVSARPDQIAVLASKRAQRQAAREAGLPTLPTWLLRPGVRAQADVDAVPDQAFPLVLRPDLQRLAGADFKLAVVADRAELLQRLPALQRAGAVPWIAQPLGQGPNLLVHAWRNGCAGPGDGSEGPGALAGHLAFITEVKFQGLSVLLQPVPLPQLLREACVRLETRLGLAGVYHYDFVQCAHSGQVYFLDLNPRLGGSTGKVLAAGYDEPLALAGTLQLGGLPAPRVLAPTLRRSGGKHQALRALWSALRGRSTVADHPYPQRARLCLQLLVFLLFGRDEIVRLDALRSLLAFAAYQVLRRWAGTALPAAGPAGAADPATAPAAAPR